MSNGILLVEDQNEVREILLDSLNHEFSEIRVQGAATVKEAQDLLRRAHQADLPFSVVILDLKLPLLEGAQPEYQFDFYKEVQELSSRDTVVFFISSFAKENIIQDFINKRINISARMPKPVLIPKNEDWIEHLFEQVRGVVHSRRISRKFREVVVPLFDGADLSIPVYESAATYRSPRDRSALRHADATHQLADLAQDIEDHWKYLDQSLKDQIQRYFAIESKGDKVSLILF
jgi:CheY-like chemotaxis protein